MNHTIIDSRPVLTGLRRNELESLVQQLGEKPFRAKQLEKWLFEKTARNFEDMSDLSKAFRQKLSDETILSPHKVLQTQSSRDGTTKFLISLADGQ
ncbi:MAG: 23S rRNA (adenine(2503)-C(2))-methyltransferase RlmN, partial [Candidatus Sericytochromatia bacterium]